MQHIALLGLGLLNEHNQVGNRLHIVEMYTTTGEKPVRLQIISTLKPPMQIKI